MSADDTLTDGERRVVEHVGGKGHLAFVERILATRAADHAREVEALRAALVDWRDECLRWRDEAGAGNYDELIARAEQAEAERDRLRAGIEALADRWKDYGRTAPTDLDQHRWWSCEASLRALLADHDTGGGAG